MKPHFAIVLCLVLVGCSSGDSTAPPPEEQSGELVEYDPIAGRWSGWDYTGDFAFDVSITGDDYEGEEVGQFDVLRLSDGRLVPYCAIPLQARSSNPPTYVFDGTAGTCTPVTITFVHDPAEDRIEVFNSNGESGYLIPGTDPGPPPE